jgi:hypothetical protein
MLFAAWQKYHTATDIGSGDESGCEPMFKVRSSTIIQNSMQSRQIAGVRFQPGVDVRVTKGNDAAVRAGSRNFRWWLVCYDSRTRANPAPHSRARVQRRDPDVRRLSLEVHRARCVTNAGHADALKALYALWNKQDGNVKASLQTIIGRLLAEKMRLGAIGGGPIKG